MSNNEVSDLKKAIFMLLYDQYDVPDIEQKDSDSSYIDYIIGALIQKNNRTCPYKNYNCVDLCRCDTKLDCESSIENNLNIECNDREIEDIWKEFIGVE